MKSSCSKVLFLVASGLVVPAVVLGQLAATLTNAPVAAAGATLTNTLIIANTTLTNLQGVMANVALDPNTTFVAGSINTSPLAFADSFAALGNVMITNVAPGLLANDVDPDGTGPALSIIAFQNPSASNGTVVVSANGAFSYNPRPGFEGVDTFTYTVSDGEGLTDLGQVSITVTGMIWFVNASAPAGGDGRLTSPFNSLVGAGSLALAPTDPGDNLFLYSGNYSGGNFAMKNRQRLIGQGATASLAAIAGLTPPPGSLPLPATGGTRPHVQSAANNITLASSNLLRGLNLTAASGTALGGGSVGALTISEMSVTNTSGRALDLGNGALGVTLTAVSASGGAPGIRLANTTGSFGISGDGALAQNGTGGTIQGAGNGIELDNVQNVSLARMNITGTGGSGVWGRNVNGLIIDWCSLANNGDAVDESAIRLGHPSVADNGLIGSASAGAFPTRIANTTIRAAAEMNVAIFNFTGTLTQLEVTNVISKDTRTTPLGADGFYFETRGSAMATVNFRSCSFSNNFTQGLQAFALGQSALTVNVLNSGFTNNYEGVVFANASDADLTFDVAGNRFLNNPTNSGAAIAVVNATTVTPAAIYSGKVQNNVVEGGGVDNHLVTALFAGTGNNTLLVANNSITSTDAQFTGLFVQAGETGAGALNAAVTVVSNNVSVGTLAIDAILIQSRVSATLCAHIANNTASSGAAGFRGIYVRQRDASTFRLPGFAGPLNSVAAVTAFLQGNNPATPIISATVATAYSGGVACMLPLIATPPVGAASNHTPGVEWRRQVRQDPASEARNSTLAPATTTAPHPVLLDESQLQRMVTAAKRRWAEAGLSAEQLIIIDRLKFQVNDLDALHLGVASPGLVRLDRQATGHGWFIDATPLDDAEFTATTTTTRLAARPDSVLTSRIDLLSAVLHEMGHQLGLGDSYAISERHTLMYGFLAPGERRLPANGMARGANPEWNEGTHFLVTPINIGTLPPGKSITVVFRSTITNPLPAGVCMISNQATIVANGGIAVLSDDPRTGAPLDPTFTAVPTPPTIFCLPNISTNTAPGQCSRSVAFLPAANGCPMPAVICRIDSLAISSPYNFPTGTNTVTCTATNIAGTNTCTFTVTVRDTEPPTATCPADIVQTLPAGQTTAIINYSAMVTDNCAVTNIAYVPPSGSTFALGTNTVRVTATDSAGNVRSCTFLVILHPPNTPPLRIAGDLAPRVVPPTPVTNSLGMNVLTYVPGTNFGEGSQTLTWRPRLLPPATLGTLVQPNGDGVTNGVSYPLNTLLELRFASAPGAFGFGQLEFEIIDDGSPSLSITQSVALGVGVLGNSNSVAAFGTSFNGPMPAGAALYGTAVVTPTGGENNSPALRLTTVDFGQVGSIIVEDMAGGWPVTELDVVFRVRVGGGTIPPADGFSFNWATNLPNAAMGEEGDGDGLRVAFDTFNNVAGDAPAVDIYWRNAIIWHTPVPIEALQTGNGYADVRIRVDAFGRIYVSMGAYVFYDGLPIPGFTPIAGGRYAIGARTGALFDNHIVEDLCILPRFQPTRITSLGPPTSMPWVLNCQGTPGYNYVLETSEDLVNWSIRATLLAPPSGLFQFVETNRTSPPARFYRLRGLGAFPAGLRTLWHGDGNALDSAGPLHGTTTGIVNYVPGVLGSGFDFNGFGGAVIFGGPSLPPPWTVGMWVRRRPQIDPSSALLHDGFTGLKLEQWPNLNAVGYTQFGVADYTLNFSAPFEAWVHLTFVGTPVTVSLYVNGLFFSAASPGINLPLAQLGRTDLDRPNATVDEIAIFDRPLTPGEIMQLYRASGGN